MRRLIYLALAIALLLGACQPAAPTSTPTSPVTKLKFTYWGSDMEKAAIEQMVATFEKQNPDIDVDAIHIPYEEYLARVTAMVQNGESPDVGYLSGYQAPIWANEGRVMDMTNLIENDPQLSTTLLATRYYYAPGKIAGINTAVEATLLFYNKALFEEAGVPYPPSEPTEAWTWDEFVVAAEKLTKDVNGKHPGEAGFDPKQIRTYGVAFDKIYEGWTIYPFIFSNGGEMVNEDGTRLLLDSPESTEAMQKLTDLMWVQHVSPTPVQDQNLPGYVTMFQTGNLAMHISGHWSLLDYSSVKDLNFGVAVLPKFKKPVTVILGSPTVIFSSTKNKEAAIRFYKFHNNPEAVDLFARGLWMPLQKVYYTDPEKKKLWLDNSVHPFNTQSTFTDYVVNYSMPLPSYYVRNYAQVLDVALRPAINRIWNHEATAAEAFAEAAKASETLLQGRWDK
jgi:multiple sugar transport system substrate-binding protein